MLIALIAVMFVFIIASAKYKFVYKVTISGKEVGYVANKYEFERLIDEEIINANDINIAYIDEEKLPTYELVLADNFEQTNEEEILEQISEEPIVTYKLYAIALDGDNVSYVNSFDEAEEAVAEIKEEYKNSIDEIGISVNEVYTNNLDEIEEFGQVATIDIAKVEVEEAVKEQEIIKSATLDGVYFGVRPVTGNITSRYGDVESIRSHAHSGLDIAAPLGTDIMAAADGTVTFAGVMGGYGNLIIITHENSIQTYYGHCSKLYANVGDEVEAGDVIAAVGSTGNSTGNHLHFEIRKNGSTLNPQRYLYK